MDEKEVLERIRQAAADKATRLDLYGNQLTSLPAQIGQLTNLTRLDLRWNQLPVSPEIVARIDSPKDILDYLR